MSLRERLKEVVGNNNYSLRVTRHFAVKYLCGALGGGRFTVKLPAMVKRKRFFCGVYYACPTAFFLMIRFAACFCIWIKKPLISPLSTGAATLFQGSIGTRHVRVDGKTLRGSYDLDHFHSLRECSRQRPGVCLGQWKVNEKNTARVAP